MTYDPQGWNQQPPGPYAGQPPGSWPPPGPQWSPLGPPHKPRRGALIGLAVGVVILIAVGVGVGVALNSPGPKPSAATRIPAEHGSATSTPEAPARIIPTQVLPSEQQVREATLLQLSRHGDVDQSQAADEKTDPASCSVAANPNGQSINGQALSLAGQQFTDKAGDDFTNSVWVVVSVFDTDEAAEAAEHRVSAAVPNCTTPYTDLDTAKPEDPKAPWTVVDVKSSDREVSWTDRDSSGDTPWACGRTVRAQGPVLITTMLCANNPRQAPKALADAVTANINSKK